MLMFAFMDSSKGVVRGGTQVAQNEGRKSTLCMLQLVVPPLSGPRVVDFGPPVKKVTAYLYNLPEVFSTHDCMRVPTVSARFATAPVFWNWAMLAVAKFAPKGFLEDRDK